MTPFTNLLYSRSLVWINHEHRINQLGYAFRRSFRVLVSSAAYSHGNRRAIPFERRVAIGHCVEGTTQRLVSSITFNLPKCQLFRLASCPF